MLVKPGLPYSEAEWWSNEEKGELCFACAVWMGLCGWGCNHYSLQLQESSVTLPSSKRLCVWRNVSFVPLPSLLSARLSMKHIQFSVSHLPLNSCTIFILAGFVS